MSHSHFTKILVVLTALLVCASLMPAQPVSPLTVSPTTVSLSYQKPATPGSAVTVKVTATASTYFTVDASTVPIWLTMGAMSGTAVSAGVNVTFTPSAVGATLGTGSYYANVKLDVVGDAALTVPVSLVVSDPAPTLTVSGGSGLTFNWAQGSAYPTKTLTAVSSNEPIDFTVTAAVASPTVPANWIVVNHASGVAYNWGTPLTVSFVQAAFVNANVGDVLTGTITITPAGGSAIVTNVAITVTPPLAAITSLWPAAIPPQASAGESDVYTIVVTGTGFVSGTNATAVTVAGDALASGNGSATVVNSTTMILTIPSKKYLLTAGTVALAAKNQVSDTATTAILTVTTAPIISAVTNSASYQQQSPGATPKIAPYDMISIFGDNFGPSGANPIVTGVPDATFFNFPTMLDTTGAFTVVKFYKADGSTFIAQAPLMFASEQQINAVVPAAVTGNAKVIITVSYNAVESSQLTANVVAADPGIFATASNGTGQGAILNSDYSANSASKAATVGTTVMIYATGLGAPNSSALDTAATAAATYPKSCISTGAYMTAVNTQTIKPSPLWTTIDGAVIQSALLATNVFPPCFSTAPVVTIGGKAATVTYAGFVADSVAGLYQINATIPTSVTAGAAVPVTIAVGAATSQPGVTMAVAAAAK
jgi:uncharacterized protein (TIGR03437 family)